MFTQIQRRLNEAFYLSFVAIVRTAACDKTKFIRLDGDLLSGFCFCLILVLSQL